ncbi:SPFH domain-containing protein [Aureispira anguillae]|uniref:SPFH domain-containing protein n=1 Tax=Aureispira anguillae TaxID=2864201 RepID=A0A915YG43_9BACT|nr:SPFH domain-containing protein [Aureispira anguillae]BDS12530.1 SPFH domain-containing protein [Aureispira anguillae]
MKGNGKWFIAGIVALLMVMVGVFVNPVGYNIAGNRQVIQTVTGNLWVRFEPGMFWSGFFSQTHTYPDVITIAFISEDALVQSEISVRNAPCRIRFNDAAEAYGEATVRWRLPMDGDEMIHIHKEYKTHGKLAETALSRYTAECLKFTAQLMESETHYSGGMAQFSEDFQDQLQHGQYLVDQIVELKNDSTTRETERHFIRKKRVDAQGNFVRNKSEIQQFKITLATATIDNIVYDAKIDEKLQKKIDASTRESISKQNLITAQQEASTAQAEGKRRLVEIEYEEKQKQTKEMVSAETRVQLSKKKLEEEKIALEAAKLEAAKIKALADAESYKTRAMMNADGALDKKLEAYIQVQQSWAEAFQNYNGALVPQIMTGGGSSKNQNALNLMDIMTIKAAKDLGLDMKVKDK